MTAPVPPFPPSGSYIESVKSHPWGLDDFGITIDDDAIRALLLSSSFRDTFQRLSSALAVKFPLNFSTSASEINLISVVSLLNFAHGYRLPLHQATGRGAWDNICYLVIAMYLESTSGGEGDTLSAKGMQSVDVPKLASLLNINPYIERDHDSIPGVKVGELGGPLHEMILLIKNVLNETGIILEQQGYPDLGSFVKQVFESSARSPNPADTIVEKLVTALPGFRDMAVVNGKNIYIFKKALFLILALSTRFSRTSPREIPIPDISNLPIMSDNVNPSMLIYFGIIKLDNCIFEHLRNAFPHVDPRALLSKAPESASKIGVDKLKEGPSLGVDEAFVLRAAAIDACERMVAIARTLEVEAPFEWTQSITAAQLDMWIWSVAKDRQDYRSLPRFAERNTTFLLSHATFMIE